MKNMNYKLILITMFLLSGFMLFSQEETENKKHLKFIGIETGTVIYGSEFNNPDLIRKQDQFNYPSDIYNNTTINNWYLGAKIELQSEEKNLGILTGLRFSSLNSLSGNKKSDENNDFYYFLFSEEETSIEYLRLQGISHKANYVGIPLEVRYFVIHSKSIGLYCKASTELHYLLNSKSEVNFLFDEMEKYENEVIGKFEKTNNLFSTLYFSGGIKFGKSDQLNINLEAIFLSFILTENNSIMNNPLAGGGCQINIQMPF